MMPGSDWRNQDGLAKRCHCDGLLGVAGDLRGARERLERAREHREALDREIRRIIPYDPRFNDLRSYSISANCERDGTDYVFYVDEGQRFDTTRCSLILGDALYNLWSALDHIVYQLHIRVCRGTVPDPIQRDPAFPIKLKHSQTNKWPAIRRLSKRHRRAIEFLQPYHARNDKWYYTRSALGQISLLNNIDKHRSLHVVRAAIMSSVVPALGPSGTHLPTFGPLDGKTEVARWTFSTVPSDITEQIDNHGTAIAQVVLYEPGVGGEPVILLKVFEDAVERVIDRFEIFFR